MSNTTAHIAGQIIGNIANNITKIADKDEPICPRMYGLKDIDDCYSGCVTCWIRALEVIK